MAGEIERWRREADLHVVGPCVVSQDELEACEGCGGAFGRVLVGEDGPRGWFTPLGMRGHYVTWGLCGSVSCESWWRLHTAERCRDAALNAAAVRVSLGLPIAP